MLRMCCDSALSDDNLKPHDGETFCNVAVRRIAFCMGYAGFPHGVLANEMVDGMERLGDFEKVDGDKAHFLANQDTLVISGLKLSPHGHVAVIYPANKMEFSGSWKKLVPMVANVGNHNGIMRVSQAFPSEPNYYALKKEAV